MLRMRRTRKAQRIRKKVRVRPGGRSRIKKGRGNQFGRRQVTEKIRQGGYRPDFSRDPHGLVNVNCVGVRDPDPITHSCYNASALRELRDAWNAHVRKNKGGVGVIKTDDPEKIRIELHGYLNDVCLSEACWLFAEFAKEAKLLYSDYFMPVMPKAWARDITTWLNSLDIKSVMSVYEKLYPHFKFIGPVPINFNQRKRGECISNELCKINLDELANEGITDVGVVFNTDPDYKAGEHWVAMYINNGSKVVRVSFYDSTAALTQSEIIRLKDKLRSGVFGRDFEYVENEIEHQKGTSECGMYVMNYIINRLEGRELSDGEKRDDLMNKTRLKLYNDRRKITPRKR